jgi:proliferating cell nuclear antigen PCNA
MFEKERMYIQSMDSARVSIFEIFIPATWFAEYTHSSDSGICIGVNSSILFKVLNTYDKSQHMNIVYEDTDNDNLTIHYTSNSKSIFDKHFEIPLIDITSELLEIPNYESAADMTIHSSHFANLITQLKMFGDTMDIDCSEEKIVLTSTSVEKGKMFVEIKLDDLDSFAINDGEHLNLSFSITHLHNICLYNKLSKDIEIRLTNNFPMRLSFSLDDDAIMLFYLAPKIDDSNDV